MLDEYDDQADEDTEAESPDAPEAPAVEPTPEAADAQEPLRVAKARLLAAQRVFFSTPHAQTKPDLVDAVDEAKAGVRAAMAQAGHPRA